MEVGYGPKAPIELDKANGCKVRNWDISHQRRERPVFRIAAIGALRRE